MIRRTYDRRITTLETHRRPERFLVGYGDSGPILYTAPEENAARRPYTPDEVAGASVIRIEYIDAPTRQ